MKSNEKAGYEASAQWFSRRKWDLANDGNLSSGRRLRKGGSVGTDFGDIVADVNWPWKAKLVRVLATRVGAARSIVEVRACPGKLHLFGWKETGSGRRGAYRVHDEVGSRPKPDAELIAIRLRRARELDVED